MLKKRAKSHWIGAGLAVWAVLCAPMGASAQAADQSDAFFSVFSARKVRAERSAPDALYWKFGLSGRSYDSDRERARLAVLNVDFGSEFIFTNYLRFQADLGLALGAGRAQLLYTDFLPSNNFRLGQASLLLHTSEGEIFFRAGVLGCPYDAPQVRSCIAFPGISQTLHMGRKPFMVTAGAMQAMPTSETRFNEATELEPMPVYTTEYVDVKAQLVRNFRVQVTAAHYRFQDLPRVVAYRSYLSGNLEVDSGGIESSRFTTEFDGYMGSGKFFWDTGRFGELEVGQQWILNDAGPSSQNMGQLFWGKNRIRTQSYVFTPELVYFVTESDIAPAIYASSIYGRNNRQGYHLGMSVKFIRAGFTAKAFYTRADRILNSPTQSDQQVFSIGIETDYESIL